MLTILAALSAAAAAFLVTGPAPARLRLARILPTWSRHPGPPGNAGPVPPTGGDVRADGAASSARAGSFASSPRGRLLAAGLAGGGVAVAMGGIVGVLAALLVGVAAYAGLARMEPAARARERQRIQAMLPLAADLLTAALRAGCPPVDAMEQVGRSVGGPLGEAFVAAAATARFGADPARTWSTLTDDPTLRPVGRALVSATRHGTSPVPALERAAQDAREAARWMAESRARSLGARAAAPLGLCFLPAFVLLGIVPIVASSDVLLP